MIKRDDSYTLFYEKAIDDLETIEGSLLELEQAEGEGAVVIVNSLFRLVHNIKGSASFYELPQVVSITHSMETLLGMLRTGHIMVEPELIANLLSAKDWVNRLLEDDDAFDVSTVLAQLDEYIDLKVESNSCEDNAKSTGVIKVGFPGREIIWRVSEATIMEAQNAARGGKFVYLFAFDLVEDIEKKGKTPQDVVGEFDTLTKLIESKLDIGNLGGLDDSPEEGGIPLYLLCATIMDPIIVREILGVAEENICLVKEEYIQLSNQQHLISARYEDSPIYQELKKRALATKVQLVLTLGELIDYEEKLALHSTWEESKLLLLDLIQSPTIEGISLEFNALLTTLGESCKKRFDFDVSLDSSEALFYFLCLFKSDLSNLVTNAVVHGMELPQERVHAGKSMAGTITVSGSATPLEIRFSVFDNGRGLSDEVLQIIKSGDTGSKLPLALFVKRLRELGGHLHVSDQGQGTTVSVHLPL